MTTTTDRPIPPSLPFEPLWEVAKRISRVNPSAGLGFTAVMFSEMIGFNPRAVSRWRDEGRVPYVSADAAAVALGWHPMMVWGSEAWLNVRGDLDRIASGELDEEIDQALDHAMAHRAKIEAAMTAAVDREADDVIGEIERQAADV